VVTTANPTAASQPDLGVSITAQGTLILALSEGPYSHLFAYHPQNLPQKRLTTGAWNDITPAVSPDGTKVAFASNRRGHWDLYLLDFPTGEIQQVTNTPEYDAAPSWSPDGSWLVYESYVIDQPNGEGNLELLIRDVSQPDLINQVPIRLTNHPAADFSPAWSPSGRMIAFTSLRGEKKGIWLADLDRIDDRFQNVSGRSPYAADHATWSPDGQVLLWGATVDGVQSLYSWRPEQPEVGPQYLANGDWAVWSSDGKAVFTSMQTPNQSYLAGFEIQNGNLMLPPLALDGAINGLAWLPKDLTSSLPAPLLQAAQESATPEWQVVLTPIPDIPNGRQHVVPLGDASAPFPDLQDLVDESFHALRTSLIKQIGWDYLAKLENAYVPLTMPLFPGMVEDWLYTGRALAADTAPNNAGWMVVVREDFSGETYWHVYLRTRYQDGTQGIPLHDLPWDFTARDRGDPIYYEQGGGFMKNAPPGYWQDFTCLARNYGWERLPALSSWRMAYPATRYNEFINRDGLSWYSAMLEIYPPEAVATVTPPPPPTATPTKTPIPSQTPTPTQTPSPTKTPTITRTGQAILSSPTTTLPVSPTGSISP
jgi:TolB protein